jgi:hypothetical protein
VPSRELLVAEAEALEYARAIVREQHVRLRDELVQDFLAAVLLEIEGDAALAAVHRQEVRAHMSGANPRKERVGTEPAGEIAGLAILDLDDFRPHVREIERGIGPLNLLSDLDDTNPREWSGHARSPLFGAA